MTSSHDIVSLTTSAVEALESMDSPKFDSPKAVREVDSNREEEMADAAPVVVVREGVGSGAAVKTAALAREVSPAVPASRVEIVDVPGTEARFVDRSLDGAASPAPSLDGREAARGRGSGDGVRIVRLPGSAQESRQKLASRRRPDALAAHAASFPRVVPAQVVPPSTRPRAASPVEKAALDPLEREQQQQQQAAILSAATSAAAAAAVGTQPVLKEIESRIGALAAKLDGLEAAAPCPGPHVAAEADADPEAVRLRRELALERALSRERDRRGREEMRRRRKDAQLRGVLALALRSRPASPPPPPPPPQPTPPPGRGRLLERILRPESPARRDDDEYYAEMDEEEEEEPRRPKPKQERRLREFEVHLNAELDGIRREFEALRRQADAIAVERPRSPSPGPRPRLSLPEAPPRAHALEMAERQLERVARMQENLEQNIASIERAREADFFYNVLNDLSGDQSAVNGAVTRLMVDEALKRASREAKRQVDQEWRTGRRAASPPPETPPGRPRRLPRAKVDSGLRRGPAVRSPSPAASPPRSPPAAFGSVASLADLQVLRPGQLGNRRQGGERAPYLHFANAVRERRHSPVAVSRSPVREAECRRPRPTVAAAVSPTRGPRQRAPPAPGPPRRPRCQLLSFRQRDAARRPPEPEERPPEEEIVWHPPTPLPPSAEDVSENEELRSEDGTGLELPGWRRAAPRKPPPPGAARRDLGLDKKVQVAPAPAPTGRDPLEEPLRNRLEDEVIAEVVRRMGMRRDRGVQALSPSPTPSSAGSEPAPDGARLRSVVQEVVLAEAMRLLRRSPASPPRVVRPEPGRVATPEPSPEPSAEPSAEPSREPSPEPASDDYSVEFEGDDSDEEPKEEERPRPPLPAPRRDVRTPSRSSASEAEEPVVVVMPATPPLSPRDLSEEAPVPTPRVRPPPPAPAPAPAPDPVPAAPSVADRAAQTVGEAAVQTSVAEPAAVQTEPPSPEPLAETEPLSETSATSSESLPADSLLSEGQWLFDRSEGQHHDICVDWATSRRLAAAAMARRPTDSSSDITAEVRTLTEEGEAVWARRYEPEKDLLLQLLLEQQRGRAGDPLAGVPGLLDSARLTLPSGDFDTLSAGQVPQPAPRDRHRRSGDLSGATSAGINDDGLEDTPVRDSGGALPPGVIRVRESHDSEPETAPYHGVSASDSDRIALARYLGASMNTTTGTAASDDLTKTGLLSTTQLIQDALQTTELSATGEPSTYGPAPRHRVDITVPTLATVHSDSPSPNDDDDISEYLLA